MTKCIVLGDDSERENKPIEFVYFLDPKIDIPELHKKVEYNFSGPFEWKNIELIQSKFTENIFDIMFAYDDERSEGCIYLGHWNDGTI